MAKIDGGTMLVRVLLQAGVDTVFTLHGGHLDAILQAAQAAGLRLVDTRHEQAAGHAADGWARTTGKPGVVLVTAGPGFTDCVTAITNAYLDCVPTLFIAGAAPLRDAETLPLQGGIDQVAMVTPVTKWAHRVTHTERIPDLVAQALRIATTGRPGPVFLELPVDVLVARVDEERVSFPRKIAPDTAPAPSPHAVETVLAWIEEAKRPAILVGGGAWFSGCGTELRQFAELTRIPVFSNGKAHGLLPASHPLSGRSFANLGVAAQAGMEADLVLLFGARLGLFTRGARLIPPAARVVQVDIAGEEIGRNRYVDLGIAADCRETLRALLDSAWHLFWPEREEWLAHIRSAREAHQVAYAEAMARQTGPVHPYRLVTEIASALPPGAIVAADGGETSTWMEMVAEVEGGGSWMSHGYLGCLGTGMPFAIAAKVAHPDRPVLCVVGDGSVGLNFAEFDTMMRHHLPIVTVVNNDQLWGMSAHGQDLVYGPGRRVATELGPIRYDLAAAGFGCHAEYVEEPGELAAALERAFASGRPACVNVMTDGSVVSPVTIAMVGEARPSESTGGRETITLPYYENLEA
ncbi:MAG TPA: thiamine pyrophosphate-binding protein [Thermoanaerobaculia bacterium]|nr:thiamine pyrophosphate-binding protein [Thermoanaerobaculia bacterium]